MFEIFAGDSVDIQPNIPEKRPAKESGSQTEHLQNESSSAQAPEKGTKQIQTDISDKKRASTVEFDSDSLVAFLNRVTPEVCEYLESNNRNDPFYRYKLMSDSESSSTQILHTLTNKSDQFFCTDLSWNSNGSSLAAAYKNKNHTDWCEHDSYINIWNMHRRDFDPEKANITLETDSCVTRLAFHPDSPALIAGTKYNGQITIWNIAKDDDTLVASSESTLYAHREPITDLFWSTENKDSLITCSLDGKILVWQYLEKQNKLELRDGFIVLAEDLARSLGIKSVRSDAEVGITCMSINCEDPSIFAIGTEGGGVFLCSFNASAIVPSLDVNSIPLKSPITVTFQKHKGHVTTVQFSPFSRNVFLTSSNDGEIRIYNILEVTPVHRIHFVVGVEKASWSLIRPMVLSAVTSDGHLHILDLLANKSNSSETFPLSEGKSEGTTVHFTASNSNLLCTASSNGNIQVWMISNALITADCYEVEQLKTFAATK